MADECKQEFCAHYIGKDKFHVYRHKFIWIIFITALLTIVVYACIGYSFCKSHKQIVKADSVAICRIENQILQARRDSCYNIDKILTSSMMDYMQTSKSMLELESTKIQSDYTLLSLWACILMIVFLVFSIYSMFKTDEVLRQSREGLKSVEEAEAKAGDTIKRVERATNAEISKVSTKANEETNKIQQNAEQTITAVKNDIQEMRNQFETDVKEKSDSFRQTYEDMMTKMNEASIQNTSLIQQLVNSIKEATTEQKGQSTNGEQLERINQKEDQKS